MKRGLAPSDGEDKHPETKRQKIPALASVIVEALKVDSLQKLCSSLEPILRRVVSEEVERALAKLGPGRLGGRVSPKQIEGPDGRNLQLQFRSRLALPLFTGGKVEGEQGAAIHVVLLDANTGHIITSGPESSAKLDIFVLEGDFNNEDDDNWTEDDFEGHVVKEREGKRPLLTGELHVSLKEGVGTIGELTFTDNSSWIRSRKFRLGLKIASDFSKGIRIREAKTEAFTVKDHRGELYKKHYPPALQDEVWRLEKIGKDGSFHKRLNKAGVYTVEDFLRIVVRDLQKLRNILGSGMSNKMWESLVEHSKTCVLSGKYYVYYSDGTSNIGAIFNNIFEFSGLIVSGQYYSAESLTDSQKVFADTLVKKAYDNWMHVIEYDGKTISAFKKNPEAPPNYTISYDQQASSAGVVSSTPKAHLQLENTSFIPENHFAGSQNEGESVQTPDLNMYNWSHPRDPQGVDDFFSEEEIRMRSHEMLENEDMQHLLRVLGGSSVNLSEDGFGFSSYVPSPCPNVSFDEDRGRPSGKAVVGWLKIRAAMRWGIFVRKKAAERRAQLVELEE